MTPKDMFQSTRPARGATCSVVLGWVFCCVSIHAPRAGRDSAGPDSVALDEVSIHAPRAGRDSIRSAGRLALRCFNPRAPRGARPSRNDGA